MSTTPARRLKNISEKKHHSVEFDKSFRDAYTLKNHLNSLMHNPQNKVHYKCECCSYMSKDKSCFTKHTNSKRHKEKMISFEPN
jgi:hypothetical protein